MTLKFDTPQPLTREELRKLARPRRNYFTEEQEKELLEEFYKARKAAKEKALIVPHVEDDGNV